MIVMLLPEGMTPPVLSPIKDAFAISVYVEDAGLLDPELLQRGLAKAGHRITDHIRSEAI